MLSHLADAWGQLAFPVLCFAVLFFLQYCWRFISRYRLARLHGCKPPVRYTHTEPFFGIDSLYESIKSRKANKYCLREQQLHHDLGNTFTSVLLGSRVVNTLEPGNLEAVFSTNFSDYEVGFRRRNAFQPLFGDSIFQSDGARWQMLRELLLACFSRAQTSQLELFELHAQNLLAAFPPDMHVFDLALFFHRYAADVSTEFLFGESIGSLQNPKNLEQGFLKAFGDAQSGCEFRWLLGRLTAIWPQPTFTKNVRLTHNFIQRYVEAALHRENLRNTKPSGDRDDTRILFIDQLGRRTQDRKAIQDEVMTLFFAGTDAMAALLVNMFFVFSKRPDVWDRLRLEVQQLGGKAPSLQQLKGLQYVQDCIRETLRLYPPQPSNSRVAVRDTVLPTGGGPDGSSPVLVRKDTIVHFSTYALHRRKDLWGDDAEEFRPERWNFEKQTWKYIPFLKGPRNCIGMDFALNEAAYLVVRLAQNIETIKSEDPGDWVESSGIALESKNGVKVSIIRGT